MFLVQNENIVKKVALNTTDWFQKLIEPGDYQIRILYDENKNLTWDPGNFDKKLQPEIVQRIPRKLTIKPNWDNEVELICNFHSTYFRQHLSKF